MFWRKRLDPSLLGAFEQHAELSVHAASLLVELLRSPGSASQHARDISALEHRADKITHETIARIQKARPAPYKRAEVHRLISALDDVLDQIDAVAQHHVLFDLRGDPPGASDDGLGTPGELAGVLLEATRAMHEAMKLLAEQGQSEALLQLCVEINRLENKADAIYRQGIRLAYAQGNDALVALRWRDIYDYLEAATDACEDVANVVEGIVLRHS